MLTAVREYLSNEDGSATIEFAIIFPVIMFLFMTIAEVGFLTARSVLLERGVDLAVRDLRLGIVPNPTHDVMRSRICDYSTILSDCDRDLILEVVEMDVNSAYPQNQPNCRDRSEEIEPTISFNPGQRNRIMFIRACMIIDPLFPGVGLGLRLPKDATGGYQLASYSAYMNEP
ncbi:pilus assembly protein [Rhodobacteraceae bacterium NNCM2]|nr:pilus assembly protein [Coraliihabitans acroporae]